MISTKIEKDNHIATDEFRSTSIPSGWSSMKLIYLSLIAALTSSPVHSQEYQPGYSATRTCVRNEYREQYIPGTKDSPGYVKSWSETIEVPCESQTSKGITNSSRHKIDDNDCSEGSIIGGLLGAGLAGIGTRGKDRWLTVPAGAVGGALIGCQVDGG